MCVALSVTRERSKVSVLVETLSASITAKTKFSIYCNEDIINEGDVVSNKGHLYSFVRRDTLDSILAVEGQVFGEIDLPNSDADRKELPNSLAEMEPSENRHFNSKAMSRKAMVGKYAPILKSFSHRRIVGPRNVSHYLNEIGHKTACGEHWTPRLAFFLIKILNAPMERQRKGSPIKPAKKTKGPLKKMRSKSLRSKKRNVKPSLDHITEKLSKLGTVIRINKQDTNGKDK